MSVVGALGGQLPGELAVGPERLPHGREVHGHLLLTGQPVDQVDYPLVEGRAEGSHQLAEHHHLGERGLEG